MQPAGDDAASPSSVDLLSPYSQVSSNVIHSLPLSRLSGTVATPTLQQVGGTFSASVDIIRPVQTSAHTIRDRAKAAQNDLLHTITFILSSLPILVVANTCIDLYIEYHITTCPIVQEPKLRADASRFFSHDDTLADRVQAAASQTKLQYHSKGTHKSERIFGVRRQSEIFRGETHSSSHSNLPQYSTPQRQTYWYYHGDKVSGSG
jgi:hypothetical protein